MKSAFTLSEVAKIDRRTASDEERDRLPYVGLEDIDKEVGRFSREFKRKPETMLATKFCFTPKHILYGKLRPYLNKVALPNFHGVCTTEILPVLPDERKVNRRYLYALLLSPNFVKWASANVSGANLPRINPERLAEYRLALPPLDEQKRIAALLDKADRLRRARRYVQELSNGFLQSVFLEMFGSWDYPYYPLRDLSKDERGAFVNGPFGSNLLTSELTSSGVPVIYIRDIISGAYKRVSMVCVTDEKATELDVCKVFPGDVLVTKVGDPPGTAAIYPESEPMGVITQDVIRIRVNCSLVTPEYLSTFLNSCKGYQTLEPIIVEGTRARFSLTSYKELPIPIPPLMLQNNFANVVRRYGRIRAQQREADRQAEHLFQTLLHRAFSGSC